MQQIVVELQGTFGDDRSIAESAWTSSLDYEKKASRTDDDVKRVVEMLANNSHGTPFESVVFRFWIKMPIAIDRQFMTHRIQSTNGMSGRYRTMPDDYLNMPQDVMVISNKIADEFETDPIDNYMDVCDLANAKYATNCAAAKQAKDVGIITNVEYKRFREFIRGMLPQHNMTERVSIMNLRSFANFIKLRLTEHAQPEIYEVARQMLAEVEAKASCPVAIQWLKNNGWNI
jgi:thymidylate synthase (FAD)